MRVQHVEDSRAEEEGVEEGLVGVVGKYFFIIVENQAILHVTIRTEHINPANINDNLMM